MPQHSTTVSTPSPAAYRAARERAAIIDRSDRGRLLVTGVDRASYLHGLLTNDIAALKPGSGCYAAYLTAQGRMITDLHVYELGDAILLSVPGATKDAVLAKLDQFVITEDVKLGDVTDSFAQVAVVGPEAVDALARVIEGIDREALAIVAEHQNLRSGFEGEPVVLTRITDTGEPGFDVYVERSRHRELVSALVRAGAVAADAVTAEVLRIESGIPLWGRDMDEETIPLEAGIEGRAISFTKGCYVGQEVIVRVLHRGHGRIARRLVGLALDREPPDPDSPVTSDGREIGRVTSYAISPRVNQPIALAYLHRDFTATGTRVMVGSVGAQVSDLPFTRRQ